MEMPGAIKILGLTGNFVHFLYILTLRQYAAFVVIFVELQDSLRLHSNKYPLPMLHTGGWLIQDRVKVILATKLVIRS